MQQDYPSTVAKAPRVFKRDTYLDVPLDIHGIRSPNTNIINLIFVILTSSTGHLSQIYPTQQRGSQAR